MTRRRFLSLAVLFTAAIARVRAQTASDSIAKLDAHITALAQARRPICAERQVCFGNQPVDLCRQTFVAPNRYFRGWP